MVEYAWKPHEGPQREFCSRGEFEVLFGGAAGPGKTDCLIMEAARFVEHPRYRGIILRRTFPQLQEIIDRCFTWYPKIDQNAVYRATEHRWYFSSGATIQLGHMHHENDKYNYQGKEFHGIFFDEVTQFTNTQYLYLHSRCRSTNPNIQTRIRATTNPGGIGHMWCKARFVDIAKPGVPYIDPETGQSRVFIPAKVTDNPTLIDNDPAYIARLKALPKIERLRLLDGVWDVFSGQVFTELTQTVHGCKPFDVPPEWEHFCSFDWGFARPYSVGYYAIDYDGALYRIGSIYGCKEGEENIGLRQTPIEISRAIWEYESKSKMPKMRFRVADPACWSKTRNKDGIVGPSVIEDMGKEGLFFLKADNNRILGKMQVHQRFMMEEDIDSTTGEILGEDPRFYCFNTEEPFWRTMLNLRQDEKNIEDVDCFIAGTPISTPDGNMPIESINAGDIVNTPIGPRKVLKSYWAGDDYTTKITLSNGKTFEGTKEHKIFIDFTGLLPLCLISSGQTITTEEDLKWLKKQFTEKSDLENIQNEDIMNVIQVMGKNSEQHCCTDRFGKISMDQFREDIVSTIKTTTLPTTMLKTWNWFLRVTMQDTTMNKEKKTVGISQRLIRHGEEVSKGKRFLEKTLKNAVKILPSENLRALIVANILGQKVVQQNIVQGNAKKRETIKKKKSAPSAEKHFSQNHTTQKKSKHVVTSVVGSSEKKPVFNITVEQAHLFFANGVLSSNTDQEDHIYDEFRYACMSRPLRPKRIERVPQGTFAAERKRLIRAKAYSRRHGTSLESAYSRVR